MDEPTLSTANLSFTLDGEDEIDIQTLIGVMDSLSDLLNVTASTCYPDAKCQVKVAATRPGSFSIELKTLALAAYSLLAPDVVSYAANIVNCVNAFFSIKRHIGNGHHKSIKTSGDKIEIENQVGEIKSFPSQAQVYIDNPKLEKPIINIFAISGDNADVAGISIKADGGKKLSISREEFDEVNKPVYSDSPLKTSVSESIDTFFIRRPDLLEDGTWTLIKDRNIQAKISDVKWLSEFQAGKISLKPKMQLKVRLLTTLVLGDNGLPISGRATYEVLEVLAVVMPGNENESLLP